ncbi:MAG: transglycosylase SLT domain-containing protein [Bacteroidota bacterium]
MRVQYTFTFFLTLSTIFLASCQRSVILFPEGIRLGGPFLLPVGDERISSSQLANAKNDWRSQLAFQSDQLTMLFASPLSNISTLSEPAFTAEILDSEVNQLFAYPTEGDINVYGFSENDIVEYPESVYRQRFRKISTDVPLVYNNQVKTFIDVYGKQKRDLTQRMLGKSTLYYPYIEQVLTEKELPDELKYLVMVESAMQNEAVSSRSAAGLWQIRPITGRSLGLEINSVIDQRLDPYAATDAALTYLKKLHDKYKNWLIAIAAYNCGMGNMHRAIVRAGGSGDFWRIQRFLPRETRNYVPAFMAVVYLNNFQQEHNLRPIYPDLSFQAVDTVRIYQEVTLEKIANSTVVTLDELEFLNPALIRNKIPFKVNGYSLVLPLNKLAQFEQRRGYLLKPYDYQAQIARAARITKQKRAVVPDAPNLTKLSYRVRRGNTISSIARRYGCSVKDIQDWNGKSDYVIRVGEELVLYVAKTRTSP